VGTTLLRPAAFRDVAESRGIFQAVLALAVAAFPAVQSAAGLDRDLAAVVVAAISWLLLAAIVGAVALVVPPRRVNWMRVTRCMLFAAVPAAWFVPVMRLVYAAAHVDIAGYARQVSLYLLYPSRVWVAVVLCVALGPALQRSRTATIAISALAATAFWFSDGLRGELFRLLV
jgi:hypothetical protein